MPADLKAVEPTGASSPRVTTTQRVRSALSGRRLLAALLGMLVVPGALGVAALSYQTPAAAPASTVAPHDSLPQVPDAVARAQLDRSQQATRLARKLTAPALLSTTGSEPAGTRISAGGAGGNALPTLAVAPRATPYTLAELRAAVPSVFTDLPDGAVLLSAHLDVPVGATMVIDTQTPDLRLLSSPTAFATVISRGTLEVTGSDDTSVRIASYNPATALPDPDAADGRSFVLQIGGRMDVDHAHLSYLGFGTGTSSGVAWRGAAADTGAAAVERVKARGSATASVFTHNHFGAYTHEAQGMIWEANTFSDNEEYGFDPHDFSDGFVVAGNTARGNGKHGFIFSRGCNDNVLRNNSSYDNAGHGFMIDDGRSRQTADAESRVDTSNNNLVVANTAYDNANSGVEIEGGTGNVVSGNTLTGNDIGVRIKNGASATVAANTVTASDRYGINILDSAGQVPVTGNTISGSWAAINLATSGSATLTDNTTTDVTTPLVVDSVVTYETSWVDEVGKYIRWNPLLVLWGLILGLPALIGVIKVVEMPFLHRHRTAH